MHSPNLSKNLRFSAFGLLAGAFVASSSFSTQILASDHIDSPAIAQDRGSDIADMWAFLDPNDNTQLVLLLSTQGFIVSGEHFGEVIFDDNIRYRFEIENTGDAKPDLFVDVLYSPGVGRLTTQKAVIALSDNEAGIGPINADRTEDFDASAVDHSHTKFAFTAVTTLSTQEPQPASPPPFVVTVDPVSGAKFFAGVTDDPFFLDDTGANRFVASSLKNPGHPNTSLLGARRGRDTYAGFNTLMTAIRIPVALLRGTGHVIGINSITQRQKNQVINEGAVFGQGAWVNVDRSGNPLVNNGLLPALRKNEYNGSSTVDDANGKFRADIIKDLQNFGTDSAHITALLNVIQKNGDILRIDLNVPNRGYEGGSNPDGGFGHMGGRRLNDDVVDATFTLINNGIPLTDYVDGNDVRNRNNFPFVAGPTQPFPPGQNPDDHTRQ